MITAQRAYINIAKENLLIALVTSTVGGGKKWLFPQDKASDDVLEKAAMTALNLIAKDVLNPHEVVIASDVIHLDNFGEKNNV